MTKKPNLMKTVVKRHLRWCLWHHQCSYECSKRFAISVSRGTPPQPSCGTHRLPVFIEMAVASLTWTARYARSIPVSPQPMMSTRLPAKVAYL